jgi:hypothetical protein
MIWSGIGMTDLFLFLLTVVLRGRYTGKEMIKETVAWFQMHSSVTVVRKGWPVSDILNGEQSSKDCPLKFHFIGKVTGNLVRILVLDPWHIMWLWYQVTNS